MKLTFTGTSSTGKTTLARAIAQTSTVSQLKFISADSRNLLEEMGYRSMDLMTRDQMREFQLKYLERKLSLEADADSYVTDRSSVDVAAYWVVRDAYDLPPIARDKYVQICKDHAARYDLHIYLPFGALDFECDGYRSNNLQFHKHIDCQIREFLREWKVRHVVLDSVEFNERLEEVLRLIKE